MGLQYAGDDLTRLCDVQTPGLYISQGYKDKNVLISLKKFTDMAFQDETWNGKAADRFKGYYEDIYGRILGLFQELIEALEERASRYASDYLKIDGDTYAEFYLDDLVAARSKLETRLNKAARIDEAVSGQIKKVRSIVRIYYKEPGVHARLSKIKREIDSLVTDFENEEKNFKAGFDNVDALVAAIRKLIDDGMGVVVSGNGTTLNYNAADYIESYQQAAKAYSAQEKFKADNAEEIEANYALVTDAVERRKKDLEKRQRLAFGLQVVISVAAAAVVTVATAGAAGPVMVAAIGGVVGAASAGASSIISQSVGDLYGHGLDRVDWGTVGQEALIGGLTGAATSAIGGGFGKAIANSAKGAHPVAAKVLLTGAEKFTSGLASRAIESTVKGDDLGTILKNTFDGKEMAADFFGGAASAGIGEALKGSDKLNNLGEKNKVGEYAKEVITDEAKDAGKRFTKTVIKTGDVGEALKETANPEEIAKTAMNSVTEKAVSDKVESRREKFDAKKEKDMNGLQKKGRELEEKRIDKATDKATKKDREKYEEMYEKRAEKGENKTSKDAYVNRNTGKAEIRNREESKAADDAAAQTGYKKIASKAVEKAFDHFHDGEPGPDELMENPEESLMTEETEAKLTNT